MKKEINYKVYKVFIKGYRVYTSVLIKAAKIIDIISEKGEIGLQEISKGSDLTPSTAIKILDTLKIIGYIDKNEKTKEYIIGPKLTKYANKYMAEVDIVKIAEPYLKELQSKVNETIHLGILQSDRVMYVDKLEPKNQTIYMTSKIGITRPLYNSAMGKAMLSAFSKGSLEEYLSNNDLEAFTEHTITNKIKLKKEIDKVKELGVAFDDEEIELDCFCIGTTILKDGNICGAFSVSMPKYRLSKIKQDEIIKEIKEIKNKIELDL